MRAAVWPLLSLGLLPSAAALAQPGPPPLGNLTLLDDSIEGDCLLTGDLTLHSGDKLQLVINHQENGDCYLLDVAVPAACLYRVSGGKSRALGAPGEIRLPSAGAPGRFALMRRSYRLAFVYGGFVVCRGWDGSLQSGKAGYAAVGAAVSDPYLQPVGAVQATDDFVREQDAQHIWTPLLGNWEIEKLRDDDQADAMEADKSANAFSYHVAAPSAALTVAEKESWFWDSYHLAASARSLGTGAMGLVLHAQDADNYLLFRWASAWAKDARGGRAQFVEVVGGKPKVLTETPGGFIPNRWYRLDAATCEGNVTCSIDGAPVLRCHTDRFGLGSPGLYSEGPDGSFFDDVLIEDYESFQEDFATLARWEVVGGDWSLAGRGRAKCASGGLLASGRREWDNYRCECEVTADRGGVGLDVARQADGAAMRLRLGFPGSAYAGKAQLVSVSGAGEKVLAEAAVRAAAGTAHRLAATVEGGFVRGYVDGNQVLEAVDAGLKGGAIGLSADRPNGALFADVGVRFLRPNRPARVVREFSKTSEHNEMRGWAGPRAPWVEPPTIEPGTVWWTKGDYFGDATVTFMLRFVGLRDGSVRVTLNGSPDDEQVGAHLILTAARDSRVLKARVVDGTKPLGEGQVELSGSSCRVEFSRRGRELLLLIDGRPLALKGA